MKLAPGYWITIGLCALTIFFWTRGETFPWKFVDSMSAWTSAGQITGLLGITLFSVAMILSMRVRWTEPFFGGMNRVYIAHHTIGGLAFLCILIHPMLLAVSYFQVTPQDAAQFLLPGQDWTVNLGQMALLSLMLLLIVTYYLEIPYQLWRLTHQFLGVAFFSGAIHGIFVSSDISREPVLRWYMITIVSAGCLAYLYRTVLGRFLVPRARYTVQVLKQIKDDILEIRLTPYSRPIAFLPGQFVFISFRDPQVGRETHAFSISSMPHPKELTITVKSLGDFTELLKKLSAGTTAWIEGPYGYFQYERYSSQQVWVAGGIGITPFLSMARSLKSPDYAIDCYYCLREESEAVYLEDFAKISGLYPNFKLYPVYSSTQGRLTAQTIAKSSGDLRDADIFLCGPPPMMISLKRQFRAMGIPRERIHSEEFALL